MHFFNLFSDYETITIITLIILSFVAGFIDSVVGGGGLIVVPALLISFPNTPLTTIFGTNKIAALSGTSISAYQYSKRVKFNFKLLIVVSLFAGIASFLGAKIVSYINVNTLKPVVLIILVAIAIYTFIKKDLGNVKTKKLSFYKQLIYGSLFAIIIGFYDGFFGPGVGSFFVLCFVVVLGFEFVEASAYSKVINCVTNIGALFVFIKQGDYILEIALIMAIFNISGNFIGTKISLKNGNAFVRKIFLAIIVMMILRYSYDVFKQYL